MSDDLEMISDIGGIELYLDDNDPRGYELTEGTDWEDAMYKTTGNETSRNEIYDD